MLVCYTSQRNKVVAIRSTDIVPVLTNRNQVGLAGLQVRKSLYYLSVYFAHCSSLLSSNLNLFLTISVYNSTTDCQPKWAHQKMAGKTNDKSLWFSRMFIDFECPENSKWGKGREILLSRSYCSYYQIWWPVAYSQRSVTQPIKLNESCRNYPSDWLTSHIPAIR